MEHEELDSSAATDGPLTYPWTCDAVSDGLTDRDRRLLSTLAAVREEDLARIGGRLCDAVDRIGLGIGVPRPLADGVERGLSVVSALLVAMRIPTSDASACAIALERRACVEARARRILDDPIAVALSMSVRFGRHHVEMVRAAERRRERVSGTARPELEAAIDRYPRRSRASRPRSTAAPERRRARRPLKAPRTGPRPTDPITRTRPGRPAPPARARRPCETR